MKEGDRNSAYFRRKASNRRSKNSIKDLQDEQGVWQQEPAEIHRLLLSYFQQSFTAEHVENEAIDIVMASGDYSNQDNNEYVGGAFAALYNARGSRCFIPNASI